MSYVRPPDVDEIVIGFDPGVHHCAAAVFEHRGGQWVATELHWWKHEITQQQWPGCFLRPNTYVVAEDQVQTEDDRTRRRDALGLARMSGAALAFSDGPGALVTPGRWKNNAAKPLAFKLLKAQLKPAELKLFNELKITRQPQRQDVLDAWGIAAYTCRRYRINV